MNRRHGARRESRLVVILEGAGGLFRILRQEARRESRSKGGREEMTGLLTSSGFLDSGRVESGHLCAVMSVMPMDWMFPGRDFNAGIS